MEVESRTVERGGTKACDKTKFQKLSHKSLNPPPLAIPVIQVIPHKSCMKMPFHWRTAAGAAVAFSARAFSEYYVL